MKNFLNHDRLISKFNGILIGFMCFAAMLAAAPRAQAIDIPAGYVGITYNADLADGVDGVYQIHFVNQQSDGNLGWGFPYQLFPDASSVTQLWPTFAPYSPVVASFGVGVVANIPGDPPGTNTMHLAVFGDFSADQIGVDFSTLFPTVNESELIDALVNNTVESSVIYQLSIAAEEQGLYISPGGNFDIVAFSQGQVIGTGTFTIEIPSAVPEPANAVFMSLGVAMLGIVVTRRRRSMHAAL